MNFNKAEFEFAYGAASQIKPSTLPEVIFSGRSNVGKSSLMNKLVNRKSLARVSATPGKTATINFFRVDEFHLVDLPGYGYAKVSKSEKDRWAKLMEGYFAQDRKFALVVQIVDMRHAPSKDDMNMINYLHEIEMPFIIVLTKKDKLKKTQQIKRLEELETELAGFEDVKKFPFSAVTGEGVEEIRAYIEKCVHKMTGAQE